jgi:hypothetical protein
MFQTSSANAEGIDPVSLYLYKKFGGLSKQKAVDQALPRFCLQQQSNLVQ